jgi:2-oxoglutarate ferredoxin oxidoreductase subunit beta
LSRFVHSEEPGAVNPFPEPVGVFRNVKKPTYEELLADRIKAAVEKRGPGKVEDLFKAEDVWTVS